MGFFENWKAFRTLAKQQKLSPACQTIANGYEHRKLMMLERQFGTEKLIDSLCKAKDHNKESRISFAFIQAILENKKGSAKGGTSEEFVSEYAGLEF